MEKKRNDSYPQLTFYRKFGGVLSEVLNCLITNPDDDDELEQDVEALQDLGTTALVSLSLAAFGAKSVGIDVKAEMFASILTNVSDALVTISKGHRNIENLVDFLEKIKLQNDQRIQNELAKLSVEERARDEQIQDILKIFGIPNDFNNPISDVLHSIISETNPAQIIIINPNGQEDDDD